ncbi:MAG: high-potential iron-sulfur protein [Steroidobacteraceae bacterium]
MTEPKSLSRRQLLQRLALGVPAAAVALARSGQAGAAELPLLAPDAPAAKAVSYTEDASKDKRAAKGASCANCGLYQGATGSARGACQLFPGKDVVAKGWCSSWAPQM